MFLEEKETRLLSKIIKQVKLNNLPVVINNLCLAVPEKAALVQDEPQDAILPDVARRAEEKAASFIAQAKQDMAAESAKLYEQSKKNGFAEGLQQGMTEGKQQGFSEGKEQGFSEGKAAGFDAGKKAGYMEGFMQGEQTVRREMDSAVQQAAEEAANIIAEANRQAQLTILSTEKQILNLAVAIAEKILAYELDTNSQAVVSIVKKALDKVRDQTQITIRINPADFAIVIAAKHEFEAILQREQSVEFSADQTVSRGGCVIDSAFGSIDAQKETQMQAIRALIRSLLP